MILCEITCNSHNYPRVAANVSPLQITTEILNLGDAQSSLKLDDLQADIETGNKLITMMERRWSDFSEEEQKKIVDFVDTKCASVGFEIDRMIEQLKQEIALLGQYKTQMAADIITGRTNLSEIDYALISDVPTDHTEEVAEDAE